MHALCHCLIHSHVLLTVTVTPGKPTPPAKARDWSRLSGAALFLTFSSSKLCTKNDVLEGKSPAFQVWLAKSPLWHSPWTVRCAMKCDYGSDLGGTQCYECFGAEKNISGKGGIYTDEGEDIGALIANCLLPREKWKQLRLDILEGDPCAIRRAGLTLSGTDYWNMWPKLRMNKQLLTVFIQKCGFEMDKVVYRLEGPPLEPARSLVARVEHLRMKTLMRFYANCQGWRENSCD